jgi:hypothetical protein
VRLLRTYVLWWIALFWLWLAYQGEWNRIEWVAAAGAATLGAGLMTVLSTLNVRFHVPFASVASAASVPLQIVVDFGIITGALIRRLEPRRVRGQFVVRPFTAPRGADAAAGDRAWREVAATYSPNAYVIDVEPGKHVVLLHDLVPNRDSESPA